ncbi:hypothetical protein P5P86_05775 [Nocardioides sp. BP30]|uniref:hypothetical protein n=1 Tax=Nocardioides sp. BP30 TaxID=3036374 RepID=UPI0024689F35|nr:hypothetical protein [Nocardioides sp. BP30]WGL53335.1 hypothetical protein P5P86_05775 [Nocardioides sp. BP30]
MTNAQAWTLIGVFATTMFGVFGIVSTSFTKTMRSGFEAVGYRLEALDHRLTGQIEALDHRLTARIDTVEARLGAKIDLLDRDISVIARRVFPDEPS